jgi:hypothetical protein
MGFDPGTEDASADSRYYGIGFSTLGPGNPHLLAQQNGAGECIGDISKDYAYFEGGKEVAGTTVDSTFFISAAVDKVHLKNDSGEDISPGATATNISFIAAAVGAIDKKVAAGYSGADIWSINHMKRLEHVQAGY